MKRPLAACCLCFSVSVFAAFYPGAPADLVIGGGLLLLAVWFLFCKHSRTGMLLCCCALGFLLCSLFLTKEAQKRDTLLSAALLDADGSLSCMGKVQSVQQSARAQLVTLKLFRLGGVPLETPIPVQVSAPFFPLAPDDILWGELSDKALCETAGEPFGAPKYCGFLQKADCMAQKGPRSLYGMAGRLQAKMASSLSRLLPKEEGDFLNKLIFGYTGEVSRQQQFLLGQGGVGHLMAVSGLHVSLFAGIVFWILQRLTLPRRMTDCLCLIFAVGYVLLTGAAFSSIRAGIMAALALTADFLGRRYDGLTALGLASAGILFFRPFAAGNIGFLLSVGCSLAILTLSGPVNRQLLALCPKARKQAFLRWGMASLSVSAAVSTVTVLYSILTGARQPLLGALFNLLSGPLVPPLLLLGSAAALLGCVVPALPALAHLLALCAGLLSRWLLFLGKTAQELSRLGVSFGSVPLILCVAGGFCMLLFCRRRHPKLLPMAALGAAALFILTLTVSVVFHSRVIRVDILPLSQGHAVWVQSGTRRLLLADPANSSDTAEILRSRPFHRHGPCDILISRSAAGDDASILRLARRVHPKLLLPGQNQAENERLTTAFPCKFPGEEEAILHTENFSLTVQKTGTLLSLWDTPLWIPAEPGALPKTPLPNCLLLSESQDSPSIRDGVLHPGPEGMTLYFYQNTMSAWVDGTFCGLVPIAFSQVHP